MHDGRCREIQVRIHEHTEKLYTVLRQMKAFEGASRLFSFRFSRFDFLGLRSPQPRFCWLCQDIPCLLGFSVRRHLRMHRALLSSLLYSFYVVRGGVQDVECLCSKKMALANLTYQEYMRSHREQRKTVFGLQCNHGRHRSVAIAEIACIVFARLGYVTSADHISLAYHGRCTCAL